MQETGYKCKWCGQPMCQCGDYCGNTCSIAAAQEDPLNIRRRRMRQIFLLVGALYAVFWVSIDGHLSYNNFLLYISAGGLAGWCVGIPMSWLTYYLNKRSKTVLHRA